MGDRRLDEGQAGGLPSISDQDCSRPLSCLDVGGSPLACFCPSGDLCCWLVTAVLSSCPPATRRWVHPWPSGCLELPAASAYGRGTASHRMPLLSSQGCPVPSSKLWLRGLAPAPCSLLPLELCGPPGSVRAPVGAFATHTARFLGPALLPTLDARLAHGGCTAVLAPACPEPLGCAGQRWGPGSCQLKPDTHAAVFPGQACWRRISLGFCKLSFNVLKVSTHEV